MPNDRTAKTVLKTVRRPTRSSATTRVHGPELDHAFQEIVGNTERAGTNEITGAALDISCRRKRPLSHPRQRPPCFRPARPSAAIQGPPAARDRASAGRLLPEKAIRRDHTLGNEITRHWITSFRLVEHATNVREFGQGCKSYMTASSRTFVEGPCVLGETMAMHCRAAALARSSSPPQAMNQGLAKSVSSVWFRLP